MKCSAILVHYHTPRLAAAAVRALRHDAEHARAELEILIVDNGSSPAGRAQLARLDARVLESDSNLGYAGGVNWGVREAAGDMLLLANPDTAVRPGCLRALMTALEAGHPAAGPRLFLDPACRWHQPPADRRTLGAELRGVLAGAGLGAARTRRAWRRRAYRFWSASTPIATRELSGALLAIRRDAWEVLGPFDIGYRLYFEETDWLLRLARSRRQAVFVPAAEAVHLWAQSAVHEPRAQAWFEASARRFRRRWYGRVGAGLLALTARALAHRRPRCPATPALFAPASWTSATWLELAEHPCGFPAAGHRCRPDRAAGGAPPPPGLPSGRYVLRAADRAGRDLACRLLEHRAT